MYRLFETIGLIHPTGRKEGDPSSYSDHELAFRSERPVADAMKDFVGAIVAQKFGHTDKTQLLPRAGEVTTNDLLIEVLNGLSDAGNEAMGIVRDVFGGKAEIDMEKHTIKRTYATPDIPRISSLTMKVVYGVFAEYPETYMEICGTEQNADTETKVMRLMINVTDFYSAGKSASISLSTSWSEKEPPTTEFIQLDQPKGTRRWQKPQEPEEVW